MNTTLWIVQILLAIVFAASGGMKLVLPKDRLIAMGQTGVVNFPPWLVKFTAACELVAAAGLILPWALGIAVILTPLAAVGLMIVMVGAAWSHLRLGGPREYLATVLVVVIFLACGFVALGRF